MIKFIFCLFFILFFVGTAYADPVTLVAIITITAAALTTAALGAVAATTLIGALVIGFTTLSVTLIASHYLIKKPKQTEVGLNLEGLLLNSESAVTTRRIIYGTRRVGGQVIFKFTSESGTDNQGNTTSGTNRFLHVGIAVAGHEIESYEKLFIDFDEVQLDGSGFVTTSRYTNSSGKSFARIKLFSNLFASLGFEFITSAIIVCVSSS